MACRFPLVKIDEQIAGTFLKEKKLLRALTARLYFCHFALKTELLGR